MTQIAELETPQKLRLFLTVKWAIDDHEDTIYIGHNE